MWRKGGGADGVTDRRRKISLPWFRQSSTTKAAHLALSRQHTIDAPGSLHSYQSPLHANKVCRQSPLLSRVSCICPPSRLLPKRYHRRSHGFKNVCLCLCLQNSLESTWVVTDHIATPGSRELSVFKGQQVEIISVEVCLPSYKVYVIYTLLSHLILVKGMKRIIDCFIPQDLTHGHLELSPSSEMALVRLVTGSGEGEGFVPLVVLKQLPRLRSSTDADPGNMTLGIGVPILLNSHEHVRHRHPSESPRSHSSTG